MDWTFTATVFEWRGPAPWYFVETPPDADAYLHDHLGVLSYGWGCIYAHVTVDGLTERTALIPKDDVYLVPLKAKLRRRAGLDAADTVTVTLSVADP